MHFGILSAGIENEGHWPWPSRSFWPFSLKILGNSACLCDNSSQIWARITKFAPNMHPGILSVGIENGGHWPWPSRSFWTFWLRILRNFTCLHDICNGFELESPNLHQICLLGFAQLVLKMEVIDLDLQGLVIISTQEIAFNFALVYWSRPAKGCCVSQTCSCYVILIHPINSVNCKKYVKNVLNLLNLLFNVWCHCVEFGSVPVTCTGILTCTRGLTIDHKWWNTLSVSI